MTNLRLNHIIITIIYHYQLSLKHKFKEYCKTVCKYERMYILHHYCKARTTFVSITCFFLFVFLINKTNDVNIVIYNIPKLY